MSVDSIAEKSTQLSNDAARLAEDALSIASEASQLAGASGAGGGGEPFIFLFTVFVLACFIGFYVVWSVTPALHSPLMSVTNAISSVIIVGGLLAVGPADGDTFAKVMGFFAVMLASVNIFGGFTVTNRMLSMFKKKEKKTEARA